MNYFIDTNIALGHTIVPDRIHQSTKKFIDENYKNTYWSTLVRKEYQKKFDNIFRPSAQARLGEGWMRSRFRDNSPPTEGWMRSRRGGL